MSYNTYAQTQEPATITTRGDFDKITGKLNPGVNATSYRLEGEPFPGLQNNMSCPETAIIFVHGWGTDKQYAINNYNDIAPTLSSEGFVSIFSWDSDNFPTANKSISIVQAGQTAQTIADQNALKLANFIFDYGTACPDMDIRLMTHSLGNRLTLQTLNVLDQYRIAFPDKWSKLLASVDLMAAGVASSSVAEGGEFHKGLAMAADIHNYYSSQDPILNILAFANNLSPNDQPLGHTDAPTDLIYSTNLTDIVGTDHHAYITPAVMERVVSHWDHSDLLNWSNPLNYSPDSFCLPGIQECNSGDILLSVRNGSSICNLAFDQCSIDATTEENMQYLQNRANLTATAESIAGPEALTKLSDLFDQVFQGNSTAVPALFEAFDLINEMRTSTD